MSCNAAFPLSQSLNVDVADLALTEEVGAARGQRGVCDASTRLYHPFPGGQQLFVGHLFRIICDGKNTAHEESIKRNFLSRLMPVKLCAQWRPLLRVALEVVQVGVGLLQVLWVLQEVRVRPRVRLALLVLWLLLLEEVESLLLEGVQRVLWAEL